MAKPSTTSAPWASFLGVRRVTAEYRAFQRNVVGSKAPQIFDLTTVNDNILRWRFRVKDFDEDVPAGKQLNKDLRKMGRLFGQDDILMEVNFPPDYPTNPFFLRVVSPRCVMYTGHVTAGGSICIEALVPTGGPGGWRSDYSVEGILVLVLANMLHAEVTVVRTATGPGGTSGPLRVDLSKGRACLSEYSMAQAQAAYGRTVTNHGWGIRNGGSGSRTTAAALPPPGTAMTSLAGMASSGALAPQKQATGGKPGVVGSGTAAAPAGIAAAAPLAATGQSPAHRTRARTAAAMQPAAGTSAAAAAAPPVTAAAAADDDGGLDNVAVAGAHRGIVVIAEPSSAVADKRPAAAGARGQPAAANTAGGPGPSTRPEIVIIDDDEDEDVTDMTVGDGCSSRAPAAPGRRTQGRPQHAAPAAAAARKRHWEADDDEVVVIDEVDTMGAADTSLPHDKGPAVITAAAHQPPAVSSKQRQGSGDGGDGRAAAAAAGGRSGIFTGVMNLVSDGLSGKTSRQGAAKAPAPDCAATGQPQQRGIQAAAAPGRVAALTAATAAAGPTSKRQRIGETSGAAGQADACAAPPPAAATATGRCSATGVAAATASMAVATGGAVGTDTIAEVAAAAAAAAQAAADAAVAALTAQLDEAKAKLEQEQRTKKRMEEKMQELAAQALLAKGTGGARGASGASTSAGLSAAAGTSKAAARDASCLLLSAPPPPHWEPLQKEEGFGVKMVVLLLKGDPLAGTSSLAVAESSGPAAHAPLKKADVQTLMNNGLTQSDATDLLEHCNGSLDEALALAFEAADCGGIIALLKRQRQAAAVTTTGGSTDAAAKAAALPAELECVLARFEKASGLSRSRVVRVERVQNWRLWTKYCMRRSEIEGRVRDSAAAGATNTNGLIHGQGVNEYLLWHGTSNRVVELVVKDGFDSRESSRVGALGEGIYFAANANYSVTYTGKRRAVAARTSVPPKAASASSMAFPGTSRSMLLCRVALGIMAPGGSGIRKPPPGADSVYMTNTVKPSALSAAATPGQQQQPVMRGPRVVSAQTAGAGCDGAAPPRADPAWDVGSALGDDLIVAVFDNAQAYPEYVVHFK